MGRVRRTARAGLGAALLGAAWLVGVSPAAAADVPCPEHLSGIPLSRSGISPSEEGFEAECYYSVWDRDERARVWAYFDPTGEAGEDTGGFVATAYCLGYGDKYTPTGVWSDTHRAYSNYSLMDGFPEAPARRLAAELLGWAEGRAMECPPSEAAEVAPTETSTTPAPGVSVSPSLDPGGRTSAGSGGGIRPAPPPQDALYSGEDAVRILLEAGLVTTVRGDDGSVIGYRPAGDLRRFLTDTPQWQPAFDRAVPTPGGTATHLAAAAFLEHPDGLLRDITIAVREAPPTPASEAPAGGSDRPEAPTEGAPGEPLSERLGRAWAEAHVLGLPLELVLERPSAPPQPPPTPTPTQAPSGPSPSGAPQRPPADVRDVPSWLASPGWKAIRPSDLPRLLPGLFGADGSLKPMPYAGARPKVTISGGAISIEVSSPIPFVPDIKVRGQVAASGGHLVPTLDELTLDGRGFGDRIEHQRTALRELDRITQPVRDAGLRFEDVRLEDGELRLHVQV